jgi:PAS domain S-box-containing protein
MANAIRVLHVDDDPDVAELTASFLTRADDRFEVETVADADAALERLDGSAVDCIVSDYDMPGRNGIEFLRAVRESYRTLPFILFTGKGSEAVASEAVSAGVTDYLQKGIGTEQYDLLANRITNAVSRNRARTNYRELFENAEVGLAIADHETGEIRDVNPAYADIVGHERDDVVGANPGEFTPEHAPYAEDDAVRQITGAVEDGPASFEWLHETADGDERWVEVTLTPVELDGRQRVLASVEDITERKARERELAAERDRYRSLFESNPLIVWEQDFSAVMDAVNAIDEAVPDVETYLAENPEELDRLADRIRTIDVNRNALSHYDADSKAELMERLDEVMAEVDAETLAAQWAALADGATRFRTETVSRSLSGERREEVLDLFVPEAYADDYARVYVTGTDITERKRRERRLKRQNERLDQFTSVVSHDLRNPLNVAASRLELASDECDSPHLDGVAAAHDRMERLIDDLLTFARAGSEALDVEPVDLPGLLGTCWGGLRTDGASLDVGTGWTVRADRDRLRQLFENLLANAVEHGGADVSITVGDLDDDTGFYVADDGPGIDPEDRETVFEAGHSTAGTGTGFGLSIVSEVAEAHGWDVSVTDAADGGARFEVSGVEVVDGASP